VGPKDRIVVDEDFFNQLGKMKPARDITNSELLWFVVCYEETPQGFVLKPKRDPFMTTLKEAMDGWLRLCRFPGQKFEEMIRERLKKVQAKI